MPSATQRKQSHRAIMQMAVNIVLLAHLSESASAGPIRFISSPAEAPSGVFVFGVEDIYTGDAVYGYPKNPAGFRSGGHYVCLEQALNGQALPPTGYGRHGGFGFVREQVRLPNGTIFDGIYIGEYGSFKAAGANGSGIGTVNPRLPHPHPTWHALLPEEYAPQILENLVQRSKLPLYLDGDFRTSTRFPFDFKKQNATSVGYEVENIREWLPGAVMRANRQLTGYNIGVGYAVPDTLAIPPDITMVPDMDITAFQAKNLSRGMVEGWEWQMKQDSPPRPTPQTASRPQMRSFRMCATGRPTRAQFAGGAAVIGAGFVGGAAGAYGGQEAEWYLTDGQTNGAAGRAVGGYIGGTLTTYAVGNLVTAGGMTLGSAALPALPAVPLVYLADDVSSNVNFVATNDPDVIGESLEIQDALFVNGFSGYGRALGRYYFGW